MHQTTQILVYTHGKSEFRLVVAHHHIGKAYLNYKCYEQAIDHLTLALKKNSKLTQIKETKLYHTYILRGLSKCYYEISSFEDALEVLSKAEDIQNTYYNESKHFVSKIR
jgi:tetratricopeptide (TPR) repeat protein